MPRRKNKTSPALLVPPLLMLALVFVCTAGVALAANEAIAPKLAIPIPTVSFSSDGSAGRVPFIAQYITGLYEYAAGVASTLAGVMMVIAGFQYLNAGAGADINAAKKRITDAIIGLLLTLGAYVILNTVNPALVRFGGVAVKPVLGVDAKTILADGAAGGGFAPPEAFTKPFNPDDSPALLPPGASSTGGSGTGEPPKNGAMVQTDKADEQAKGVPPASFTQYYDGDIPDLYDKNNEYGTWVRTGPNTTFVSRMNDICVSRLKNKGPNDLKSVLKRAAAITRVWIIEGVYNGGAIYDRGSAADFYFVRLAYKGSDCMQGRVSVSDLDQCDINKQKCPVSDYKSVHTSLQQAYTACKNEKLKGFSRGQCTGWVLSLAACALGPKGGWKSAEKDATLKFPTGDPIADLTLPKGVNAAQAQNLLKNPKSWAKMKIDPKYWLEAIKTKEGPKPFDVYHLGRAAYSPLSHTVMYIGGMNLKGPKGEPIYWIEMGGGGPADLGGPRNVSNGKVGCPRPPGEGGCSTGASIHFSPYINTFNALAGPGGGSYFARATLDKDLKVTKDDGQIMVRLLDQVPIGQ